MNAPGCRPARSHGPCRPGRDDPAPRRPRGRALLQGRRGRARRWGSPSCSGRSSCRLPRPLRHVRGTWTARTTRAPPFPMRRVGCPDCDAAGWCGRPARPGPTHGPGGARCRGVGRGLRRDALGPPLRCPPDSGCGARQRGALGVRAEADAGRASAAAAPCSPRVGSHQSDIPRAIGPNGNFPRLERRPLEFPSAGVPRSITVPARSWDRGRPVGRAVRVTLRRPVIGAAPQSAAADTARHPPASCGTAARANPAGRRERKPQRRPHRRTRRLRIGPPPPHRRCRPRQKV